MNMALYTGKGDQGDTGTFGTKQRMSKNSTRSEALGALDEVNSFLGLCKVRSDELVMTGADRDFKDVVDEVQQNLFIIQAEIAGADKTITKEKVEHMEHLINEMKKELPPINSFFVSGGTQLATLFDVSRTMARRAERRVVALFEEGEIPVGEHTRSYLNRLSSLLYAMARLSNHKSGITEEPPTYKWS